jgi:hypothetical protein
MSIHATIILFGEGHVFQAVIASWKSLNFSAAIFREGWTA